jgi:hypothetical protein
MLLSPPSIDGNMFSWKNGSGCAEASDFGPEGLPWGRVYDDACDVGFTVVSNKSGKCVVFALNHTEINDGDIQFWEFVSVTPNNKGIKIKVFND